MARARNIKPGFFTNEYLADLPMETRLLFAGLWTIADREGRIEDRPKRIKGMIFPYDDVDVDNSLQQLADSSEKFIIRYEVDGNNYIQITKFVEHQYPDKSERKSIIPPFPGDDSNKFPTSSQQVPNEFPTSSQQVPKGILCSEYLCSEYLCSESLGKEKDEFLSATPQETSSSPKGDDLAALVGDRGPDDTDCEIIRIRGEPIKVPIAKIMAVYNATCTSLPKIKNIQGERRKALVARFRTYADFGVFETLFTKAQQSDFLRGNNEKNWHADFDWLIKANNMDKVLEGKYDNRNGKGPPESSPESSNPFFELLRKNLKEGEVIDI